jgi:hypothetical protein
VLDIGNEQAMRVPIVADQPNRRSASSTKRELVGSIDAQSGSAVRSRNVSIPLGGGSVDILDVAIGRIACREEIEFVEEVVLG